MEERKVLLHNVVRNDENYIFPMWYGERERGAPPGIMQVQEPSVTLRMK